MAWSGWKQDLLIPRATPSGLQTRWAASSDCARHSRRREERSANGGSYDEAFVAAAASVGRAAAASVGRHAKDTHDLVGPEQAQRGEPGSHNRGCEKNWTLA
jgi:hypothetical protein